MAELSYHSLKQELEDAEETQNSDSGNALNLEDIFEEDQAEFSLDGSLSSIKKRRCFSVATKLEAIEYARNYSMQMASEKYGVDRKCIRDWLLNEDKLR